MAFFDDLGKKISNTSQTVVQKAKGLVDISGLKGQIGDEEKKINKYYQNLGRMYYDLQKDAPMPELKELVEMINASYQQIEAINQSITNIENTKNCPNCGAPIADDMVFCVGCGYKIERAPEVQQPAGPRFCVNCGNQLMPGAMFCTKCGTKQN